MKGRIFIACLLSLAGVVHVLALDDSDGDGMSDLYEIFYGLNANDAADAAYNDDADTLNNLAEHGKLTDPFFEDTDRDRWYDGVDSNPISRAYIDWGNAFFTTGNVYEYAAPGWWLNAEKAGGEWITNSPSSWHVDFFETNSTRLLVDIDNTSLSSDLVLKLSIYDHTNALLYVDLMDSNAVVIATNIVGNVSPGNDAEATVLLDVPLLTYTNTSTIILRRGEGEVTVFSSLLYVDEDGDGLDADQEFQLGTSDNDTDNDGDGLSDYDEVFAYGTNPALADTDADGLSDYTEVNTCATDRNDSDSDNDGLSDGEEIGTYRTNPNDADSDGDQMGDGWEVEH